MRIENSFSFVNLGKMLIYKISSCIFFFCRGNNLFEILRVEVCFSRKIVKNEFILLHTRIHTAHYDEDRSGVQVTKAT